MAASVCCSQALCNQPEDRLGRHGTTNVLPKSTCSCVLAERAYRSNTAAPLLSTGRGHLAQLRYTDS